MTREEQLKFCSVCKNRQMDMKQGLLCGLTNAKADFEGTCPDYDEDSKELKKIEGIDDEHQKTLTVSGWLAFFLWVGVGLGAAGSCLFSIAILKDAGLTFVTSLIYVVYLGSLVTTAILTIKAFYQKAPNAVALAKTYIAMIAIDGVVSIAGAIILEDNTMWADAVRSFIWAVIWITYISNSTHIANMIPLQTRRWKMPEKILLVAYSLACMTLVGSMAYFFNNPMDSNFYQKEAVIDGVIESANEDLPDYSDPFVTQLKFIKENNQIVYPYKINNFTETLDEVSAWELALVNKQEILAEEALEEDQDVINIMNLFFDGGYDVCYRYLNANGDTLYEIVINGSEYNNALAAASNFKCDEKEYQSLIDYYMSLLPSEYMGDATLVGIRHTTNSLSYSVQLPYMLSHDLIHLDSEYLEGYVIENWKALDDNLKTLARINKEDVSYHFYTAEGEKHCTITIPFDEYINFAEFNNR